MFERLTEPARQVVVLAQEEARGLDHEYVGTEHLLLGLLRVREGVGARALMSMGITPDLVRDRIVMTVGRGESTSPQAVPFTTSSKRLLVLALEQAVGCDDVSITTGHFLLAVSARAAMRAARICPPCPKGGRMKVMSPRCLPSRVCHSPAGRGLI